MRVDGFQNLEENKELERDVWYRTKAAAIPTRADESKEREGEIGAKKPSQMRTTFKYHNKTRWLADLLITGQLKPEWQGERFLS